MAIADLSVMYVPRLDQKMLWLIYMLPPDVLIYFTIKVDFPANVG